MVGRLTEARDFAALRREGRSGADRLLVVVVRPNGREWSRVGFSVSKRLGNAVVRNRTKRRLREAVRLVHVSKGLDFLVIARKDAPDVEFEKLCRSLKTLFKRTGILSDEVYDTLGRTEAC